MQVKTAFLFANQSILPLTRRFQNISYSFTINLKVVVVSQNHVSSYVSTSTQYIILGCLACVMEEDLDTMMMAMDHDDNGAAPTSHYHLVGK